MSKTISETICDLEHEERHIEARIVSLRSESAKLKLAVAKGDTTAAARRTEILGELQAAQQDLLDTRAAVAEAKPLLEVERAQNRLKNAQAVTSSINEVLANRTGHAAKADELAIALGLSLRILIQSHRSAGTAVRRSMPIDEAIGLDFDELGVMRAALSLLFTTAGIDFDDAVRSLEGLRFGTTLYSVVTVQSTVEQQNTFVTSMRENLELRLAGRVADLESPPIDEPDAA